MLYYWCIFSWCMRPVLPGYFPAKMKQSFAYSNESLINGDLFIIHYHSQKTNNIFNCFCLEVNIQSRQYTEEERCKYVSPGNGQQLFFTCSENPEDSFSFRGTCLKARRRGGGRRLLAATRRLFVVIFKDHHGMKVSVVLAAFFHYTAWSEVTL